MRRLVVFSALLTLAGLLLLLPSSQFWDVLTSGSSSSTGTQFALSAGADNTSTLESVLGFGAVGVALLLQLFSLFTEVGGAAPPGPVDPLEGLQEREETKR